MYIFKGLLSTDLNKFFLVYFCVILQILVKLYIGIVYDASVIFVCSLFNCAL
jgi:hypothetical protein